MWLVLSYLYDFCKRLNTKQQGKEGCRDSHNVSPETGRSMGTSGRDTDKTQTKSNCNGCSSCKGRKNLPKAHPDDQQGQGHIAAQGSITDRRAEGKRGKLPTAPPCHHCSPMGQVMLRCFASGAAFSSEVCTHLHAEMLVQRCKFPTGGCSPCTLQTQQEAPGLWQSYCQWPLLGRKQQQPQSQALPYHLCSLPLPQTAVCYYQQHWQHVFKAL